MKQLLPFFLLLSVAIGAYFYYVNLKPNHDPGVNNTGFLKTEEEFRRKLAEFRIEQDKVERRILKLEEHKNATVASLKEKGVTSKSDLSDQAVKLSVNDLKRDIADIAKLQKVVDKYEEGILSIEAMLKEIQRNRIADEVEMSDEKALEISKIMISMEEKLGLEEETNFLEDEDMRNLLKSELGEEGSDDSDASSEIDSLLGN